MLQTELNIYSDGGSRNNPGKAACAFIAFDSHGNLIHQEYKYLGITTNNIAEYEGVILAIHWLKSNLKGFTKVNFYLDSQLVVNQLNGIFRIKDSALKQRADQINLMTKLISIKDIKFIHILRNLNFRADFLVNQCLDQI